MGSVVLSGALLCGMSGSIVNFPEDFKWSNGAGLES